MIENYIKTTLRSLQKNRSYSFLNIAGLAIGIACASLIFLWVEDELTFNHNFVKRDVLYKVYENQTYEGKTSTFFATPGPMAKAMKTEIAGIKNTARMTGDGGNALFALGDKIITETGQMLGYIAGIFVTVSPEPLVIYEVRESMLDALLGRHRFMPASAAHALSDDRQRLIVPHEAAEIASLTIEELLEGHQHVRSFSPSAVSQPRRKGPDDTIVVLPIEVEDETVVRMRDDDETVVHQKDDDETVIRFRRKN